MKKNQLDELIDHLNRAAETEDMEKIIRKIHVTDVKAGDTIIYNGKESTVCQKDIIHDSFMGISVFGDCYNSGHKLVEIVDYEQMRRLVINGRNLQ